MNKKCLAIGIILLFVGVTIAPALAQNTEKSQSISRGNWLYVGGSGPGNYTRIQDAIDDASDGDTVFVYNGIYSHYSKEVCVRIGKQISLIGEDKYQTIIDVQGHCFTVIEIMASYVNISNVTIKGTDGAYGILTNFHYPTLRNISIHDIILLNNDVTGLFIRNVNDSKFYDNIILNTTYNGIYIEGNFWNNTIYNNTIANNEAGINIYNTLGNYIIEHNNIQNNKIGIAFSLSTGIIRYNNLFKNTFSVRSRTDISIEEVKRDPFLLERNITWDNNYWSAWKISLPRPIFSYTRVLFYEDKISQLIDTRNRAITNPFGKLGDNRVLSRHFSITYDERPTQEPYDIPGMS